MKKIFTLCLLALIGVTNLNAQCNFGTTLINNGSYYANMNASFYGQSFTAACTGSLTSITINTGSQVAESGLVLYLFTGSTSFTAPIAISNAFTSPAVSSPNALASVVVTFPSGVALTAGTVYSFICSTPPQGRFSALANQNADIYAGGNALLFDLSNSSITQYPTSDLLFKVDISNVCVPTASTFKVSACDSYTWAAKGNKVYTVSNNADTIHLTNARGCDSVITLNLTISSSRHTVTTQTACNNFVWNGTSYTSSGIYTYNNGSGCSTLDDTLKLTINALPTAAITSSLPTTAGSAWVVSTLAGSGVAGYVNGIGTAASFNRPVGITTDIAGNIYVGDRNNRVIRKITPAGVVTTFAGSGALGRIDGPATLASFRTPIGLTIDARGNIYVADANTNQIRKITPSGVVSTLAGDSIIGNADGIGAAASFNGPSGITTDATGNVYVGDFFNRTIRKITPAGVVTTFAGGGVLGFADGTGTAASFGGVWALVSDALGNLYAADGLAIIRKITPSAVVTTIAGRSGVIGNDDGTASAATFSAPSGIAIDASGNLYVSDGQSNLIRKITPSGVVTTIAGSGVRANTDGLGLAASFNNPNQIAIDVFGNMYIADVDNHSIRKMVMAMDTVKLCYNSPLVLAGTGGVSYSWSGPQTISNNVSFAVTTSGVYTVTVTNAAGCTSTKSIYVLIRPTSSSSTSISYCQSQLPTTWNGLTISAAGTYIAHFANAVGCDSVATLVATIKPGQLPTVNYSTGVNITTVSLCSIGSVTQIANYTAPNGTWITSNPGVVTVTPVAGTFGRGVTIKAISAGTATVSYTGIVVSGGCPASINSLVTVNPQATPSAITGSATACVGAPSTYSSNPTGGVWTGARGTFNSNIFTPSSAGATTLTYTVTNAGGCSASVTKAITINAVPAMPSMSIATPVPASLVSGGGYCKNKTFGLTGNPVGGVWGSIGVVSLSVAGILNTGNTTGVFNVSYTVANASGCTSTRTIPANVVACGPRGVNGQIAVSNEQLAIYPNPAHLTINFNLKILMGKGSIVVTDLYGKTIKQQTLSMGTNTIDVSAFAKGMYLVSVITEQGKQTQKVIIE